MTPRLYQPAPILKPLHKLDAAQSHYLCTVLRLRTGDKVSIFNEKEGEWQAKLQVNGKNVTLLIENCLRPAAPETGPQLLFAPLKRAAQEWLVEKATELGVASFQPVFMQHSHVRDINLERCHNISREAAEQCERLTLPHWHTPKSLTEILSHWPKGQTLFYGYERSDAPRPHQLPGLSNHNSGAYSILVGPEGGFATDELAQLAKMPETQPISLGPRILRAETAALALLASLAR